MSYGHANLRDARRDLALPRLEKALASAKAALKAEGGGNGMAARVTALENAIAGTKANRGKGTRALQGKETVVDLSPGA